MDAVMAVPHVWHMAQDLPVRADEWQAIQESVRGNREAFGDLVRRYQQEVARLLWRFTRDPDDLEDLVQETFLEAFKALASYRGDAPFLWWLRRIATRTGYRYWTHKRDRAWVDVAQLADMPDEGADPREAASYLYAALQLLPPPDRLVLTLCYFEDCSTREIAARTGWSTASVKVRLFRARKRLKTLLERAESGRTSHG